MPELPEVECVRRGLAAARLKAPVVRVWRSKLALRTGAHWSRRLEHTRRLQGARPGAIDRRGKFLLWSFVAADGADLSLLVHLGMSGHLDVVAKEAPVLDHTHLRLGFEDGRELRFVDPRRFGGLRVASPAQLVARPPLDALGPEPLDPEFDGEVLAARLGKSRRVLRDGLLDQRVVAGLGNIYVSEALYEAGLHPLVQATRLRPSAWARLADATRLVLQRAIDNGGTTLRDYRGVDGAEGRNQGSLRAYGRAGEPCPRCPSTHLVGYVHQGRSGAYCPNHQSRPKGRWVP